MTGEMFGPYEIGELLGQGGFGEVHQAYDTAHARRLVALKRLAPAASTNPETVERFRREAERTAALTEPHIIPIHDYGEIEGRLYLTMRLVEGTDLRAELNAGPLTPRRVVSVITQLASALDSANAAGLVHRDVKPSNVLVRRATNPDTEDFVYLIDFGIAHSLDDPRLSSDLLPTGTLAYMAPERFDGAPGDRRVDVYSLGCVLYEALTGRPAFAAADRRGLMRAHRHDPPPRLDPADHEHAEALNAVIARALAKDPERRYPTAGLLAAALRAAVVGVTEPADEPPAGSDQTGSPSADTSPTGSPTGQDTEGTSGSVGGPARRLRLPSRRAALVGAVAVAALVVSATLVARPSAETPTGVGPAPAPASAEPAASCAGLAETPPSGPGVIPSPLPTAAAALPRGPVIFRAPMDGSSTCFADLVGQANDPARAVVRFLPGKIELAAMTPNTDPRTDLKLDNAVSNFIGDIGISVDHGSDVKFVWGLRWAVQGKLAYELYVDTAAGFAQLAVWDGTANVPLTPRQPIPDLHTGRVVPITVLVDGGHLGLWIDGTLRAEVHDDQVPPRATYPGLDVYANERPGTVAIHGLDLYALPRS
ncbi:MAG: protein kinase [Pseudonocardia sp.]|nr:protein kinase [Pseudonocardia sp.]